MVRPSSFASISVSLLLRHPDGLRKREIGREASLSIVLLAANVWLDNEVCINHYRSLALSMHSRWMSNERVFGGFLGVFAVGSFVVNVEWYMKHDRTIITDFGMICRFTSGTSLKLSFWLIVLIFFCCRVTSGLGQHLGRMLGNRVWTFDDPADPLLALVPILGSIIDGDVLKKVSGE